MPRIVTVLAVLALFVVPGASLAQASGGQLTLPGLDHQVKVKRDGQGVPHISASTERDAYYAVGYMHAEDRLFQMDATRRQASGTLAELLGPSALASDGQLRTLGLRRAAQRSLNALSPQSLAILDAYSAGVNAWLARNPLPSEYAALELTKANVPAWTPLDSAAVNKLLAFGLSFDLNDISNTQKLIAYQTAGAALGFNGAALFSSDVMRSDPFEHAPSIFPGETSGHGPRSRPPGLGLVVEPRRRREGGGRGAAERQAGARADRAHRQRVEHLGRLGFQDRERAGDHRQRPAPLARLAVHVLRGRHRGRRRARPRPDAVRRHLPRRAHGRAGHERACLVGLHRQPDRRHRRLLRAAHVRRRRAGGDHVQGQPGADADHSGDLPRQPAR